MLIVIRFMRFDPATQVISGTPLRGDVNCRSDQWHPAKDRCREGGFHLVRLGVTDLTFTAYQEFVVHVLGRVFSKSGDDATRIMLHVHQKGVGVCGVFTYEVAETKVTQAMDLARKDQHPLQCALEKE